MKGKVVRPRSVLSVVFISFALGPLFTMLWLGRGAWALVYLAVAAAAMFGISFLEDAGYVSSAPLVSLLTTADIASLGGQALAGIIHGLAIRRSSLGRPWYRWIAALPAAAVCILAFVLLPLRIFVLQPFTIPSSSLFPALVPGDYVLVSKTAYGYSRYSFPSGLAQFDGRYPGGEPRRGDIAVFKLPSDDRIDYVKRVIGLPGDHIRIAHSILMINGAAVPRTATEVPADYRTEADLTFWRETLPDGRSYVVAEREEDGEADNTDEYIVPEGHYFVLGDNRDNSKDSRWLADVGYVPLDNFIGPVSVLLFNTEGVPVGNRPR